MKPSPQAPGVSSPPAIVDALEVEGGEQAQAGGTVGPAHEGGLDQAQLGESAVVPGTGSTAV